jgi:hypothetical protein
MRAPTGTTVTTGYPVEGPALRLTLPVATAAVAAAAIEVKANIMAIAMHSLLIISLYFKPTFPKWPAA